ncbi:MAG: hypothetical protein OEZ16_05810 [Chromatiales bacterium]|nr:hypothetical protein [Chromatiales bacterium]
MDMRADERVKSVRHFWDKYIQLLDKSAINAKARRWYVKRVEEYIHT